jgi:Protein of Unknown function (DUF2784)
VRAALFRRPGYRGGVGFRIVVYAAMAAHYAFMAFGVFGGFLAWRWPRLIWWQLAGVTWMVLIVAAHLSCPLTWIEDHARDRAGMPAEPGGFIANRIAGVFFPHGHRAEAMVAAAVIVAVSWAGFVRLRVRARDARPRPRVDSR